MKKYALPLLLLAALLNPAFNHRGATILAYLPSGNPLTAESIRYGFAAAGRLGAVLVWFLCCGAVMTEDKLLYLFGRVSPALSLLLSMTLRFVPRFQQQLYAVRAAQRANGGETSALRGALRAFSATVTWALEHGIELSDSMKSRGYGLEGRTAFKLYRVELRDRLLLAWLLLCGVLLVWGAACGGFSWRYYPVFQAGNPGRMGLPAQAAFSALCVTPVFLRGKEALLWKRFDSTT